MRTMVFVDHMNFYLSAQHYYHNKYGSYLPTFDYPRLIEEVHGELPFPSELVKTQLFFPYSEEPLSEIEPYKSSNRWIQSLKSKPLLDVIEGRNQIRKLSNFDIEKPDTYTVDEKGTDINIATAMLTKAFHNSYDCALLVSGDSDYVPVLDVLRIMGKTTVIACLKDQPVNGKLLAAMDDMIRIDEKMFEAASIR